MADAIAEAEAMGLLLSDEDIAELEQRAEPADVPVWPENWSAVQTFDRCLTQWRAGPSGVIGLDYAVVLEVMRLYDVPKPAETLEKIRIMEAEALPLLRPKRES